MPRPGRLEGRTCLIVGGTSGIGLAAARRFLAEGARVVVAGLEGVGVPASRCAPLDESLLAPLRLLGPCAGWSVDSGDAGGVELLFSKAIGFLGGGWIFWCTLPASAAAGSATDRCTSAPTTPGTASCTSMPSARSSPIARRCG